MATRTIANGGGNYNATGTWVEGVVPTSADDVVATATSGQLTVNVGSLAKTIDFTNYTNTLTLNNNLTISGNVTLVPAMGMAGAITNQFIVNAAAILTSNGRSIRWNLQFPNGSGAKTFADAWVCQNDFTLQGNVSISGFSVTVGGNFNGFNGGTASGGSTDIILNGTGTWSAASVAACLSNLTINTSGTITISGIVGFGASGKTLTYTAGTVTVVAGSELRLYNGAILNASAISFYNVGFGSTTGTYTLNSTLNCYSINTGNGTSATFAGTAGFAIIAWTTQTTNAGGTFTLQSGVTYVITSLLSVSSQDSSHSKFVSSTPGSQATLTLLNGFFGVPTGCYAAFLNATDINSSAGRTIWTFGAVLSNATNWSQFTGISATTVGATHLG